MRIVIKPCSTVGNAFMVLKVEKFRKQTKLAIGLTHYEALALKSRLTKH